MKSHFKTDKRRYIRTCPSISCSESSFGSQELKFSDEKWFLEKFSTGSTETWKETHELLSALSSC